MAGNRSGMFVSVFAVLGLTDCAAAGPHPGLPGPNPVMDRIFSYLQYFFPFLIIIFLCSIIGLGIYFLLVRNSFFDRMAGKNNPLEIAGERYAKGELTRDEYMQIIMDLKSVNSIKNEAGKYEEL